MKTKAIKFIMPALVIVFAIAASAFTAAPNETAEQSMITQGYVQIDPQEPCEEVNDLDCSLTGAYLCTSGGNQVYRFENGTSCSVQLRKTTPN